MKRMKFSLILIICIILHGCSIKPNQTEVIYKESDNKILIAYFTRLNNTVTTDIDDIISGGGPYGSIEKNDLDALSSASIQISKDSYIGNTEKVAYIINNAIGGDLFSIETENKYPVQYDSLVALGEKENVTDFQPTLSTEVNNMDDYKIVFIGFPDWYYDVPMAIKSFVKSYDFSNKIVIPFCTSAGSGFAGSLKTLKSLLPENAKIQEGLTIHFKNLDDCDGEVIEWLNEIGFDTN